MLRRFATAVLAVLLLGSLLAAGPGAAPAVAASPRPANFATTGDVVDYAYERLLGHEPDRAALAFWVPRIDGPNGDVVGMLDGISHSAEYDGWVGQLVRAYRTAYNRGPDLAGMRFWLGRRATAGGLTFRQHSYSAFLAGPEYDANYGGTTDREYVRRIYVNALGREPDAAGHNYWAARVGSVGRAQVAFEMSESPEHRAKRRIEVELSGIYVALLGRLPDPSGHTAWTNYLNGGGSTRGFLGAVWSSPELAGRLATVPTLTVETLVQGISIPWGIAIAPDGTMLYTLRAGAIQARRPNGTIVSVAADLADLYVNSEGGLLDLVLDPGFSSNRRFYTCMSRKTPGGQPMDVAVVAWTISPDFTSATRDTTPDPLLGGIPITAGIHSGCRIIPDPTTSGVLFVATGDASIGTVPQDRTSLGGKVLRISSETGAGVAGNPFFGSSNANERRVYNYGHRNMQGLAHRPGTSQIWTAEHGPDVDDELNLAVTGGNYGWNPVPGYNQSVPMTDLQEFPSAVQAVWSSGAPTVATSGMTFFTGCQWGAWNDHAAVALLKGRELRVHSFTTSGIDLGFAVPGALDDTFGRLRTVVQGPDGALYIGSSQGNGADKILRVTPSGGRCAAP